MGVTSSAKRGEARRAPAPPSHLKREVIGVILVALSLLTLLSLLSFVPGEPKVVAIVERHDDTADAQSDRLSGRGLLVIALFSNRGRRVPVSAASRTARRPLLHSERPFDPAAQCRRLAGGALVPERPAPSRGHSCAHDFQRDGLPGAGGRAARTTAGRRTAGLFRQHRCSYPHHLRVRRRAALYGSGFARAVGHSSV